MRKLAVAMALASTALASPALARDDAWYVGVEGGAMIVEDLSLDIGAVNDAAVINNDPGYDFGGVVGYDFGGFRAEVEVSYREADSQSIQVTGAGIPAGPTAGAPFIGTTDITGSVTAFRASSAAVLALHAPASATSSLRRTGLTIRTPVSRGRLWLAFASR